MGFEWCWKGGDDAGGVRGRGGMAITAGVSKCVGAACVRGVAMKELVLGRHQCVRTSVCTSFYGECLLFPARESVCCVQWGFATPNSAIQWRVGILVWRKTSMRMTGREFMVSG